MKKNRMMRLASILLVCVLLTTSVISGTFAKYVTADTATDSARVAAWGFAEDLTIDFELFSTSYDNGSVTTVDGKTAKVIAPGTTQTEMITLTYDNKAGQGAPEVAYTIDLNVVTTETSIADAIKNNPNIQWSFNGAEWGSWDTMITAIEAYHEDLDPNELPVITNTGIEIEWQWIFDTPGAADSDLDGINDQDEMDTAMGNTNPLDVVKLTVQLVAQQVD